MTKKDKNRDNKGKFIEGNTAGTVEKWTEEKIDEKLQEVYEYYIKHEDIVTPNKLAENLERKGILTVRQFRYLLEDKDYPISATYKKDIDFIEEGRIMEAKIPAGIIAMVLKNKFKYKDKSEVELTTFEQISQQREKYSK